MAFVWVHELFDGRNGSLRDGLQRSFVRRFQVRTDDKRVAPINVIFAPGIPRLYASYISFDGAELDYFSICRDIQAEQEVDDDLVWNVTCSYDTQSTSEFGNQSGQPGTIGQPGAGGGSGASGDPTQEPPTIEWDYDSTEYALRVDIDGDPILNSAGQPFDPPPTMPVGWTVLRYGRNEATYDALERAKYAHTINSTPFLGVREGCVLCKPIKASSRYIGPFLYYRVSYEFHIAKDHDHNIQGKPQMPGVFDWKMWLLDQGLCRLDVATGRPVAIYDDGNPISTPALLGNDGQPLTKDDIEDPLIGPNWLDFDIYNEIDLNVLNIVI